MCGQPDDGTKCPRQNNRSPEITGLPCSVSNWSKAHCPSTMPGPTRDLCGPNPVSGGEGMGGWLNTGCGIHTATAKSLDGPWDVRPLIITDKWSSDNLYSGHTNPSPLFLSNGSVIMAFNAGCADPSCSENVGTAISDTGVDGPWRLLSRNSIFPRNGSSAFWKVLPGHGCEDPFLWQSKRGYHMLVHNFEPVAKGVNGPIAYAHSVDGHSWTLSQEIPADCTLRFTDGTNLTLGSCGNRPQLAFDDDGTPIGLFGGATAGTKPGGGSGEFTHFRPVLP